MPRTMFVAVRWSEHSKVRKTFVSLPFIDALATPDPDERQKYFVLDEEPPPPKAEPGRPGPRGPMARRYAGGDD